jgi:DNA-binding NarL/FixJ family response regulator
MPAMPIPVNYPLSIVIADGHPVFREGLKTVLKNKIKPGIRIVAEVENGKDLICQVEQHQPHIVLTDVMLPVMDGIEATQIITATWPHVGVIGLSASEDVELVYKMLRAGAKGYLIKNMGQDDIAKAVQAATIDQPFYCDATSRLLLNLVTPAFNKDPKSNTIRFSDKEIEMIRLICRQCSIKEIAGSLNFSRRNIEDYSRKIREKAGVKNLVGIALFAIKHNIVQIGDI